VVKPEGKRPLGIPRRRREDNTKMYLLEVWFGVWTGSSWFKIRTCGGECHNDPSGSRKCGEYLD
jgi:hypothetical protein